ncbi:MAG: hypothetical protein OWS74_01240 [Firmicutes bacterium]|nr:hypothetical protein [Bacillota bacterium]
MQYIAQLSSAATSHRSSFWRDVLNTEQWLNSLHQRPLQRTLILETRSLKNLSPWLAASRDPIRLEGWIGTMETLLTWRYIHQFLGADKFIEFSISCGSDAFVSWSPSVIVVRAPRQSWIWDALETAWDPAAWPWQDHVEWDENDRLHQAHRLPWGAVMQRNVAYGIEEWVIAAATDNDDHEQQLRFWWQALAARLGTRPVKIRWVEEKIPSKDTILELPVRLSRVHATIRNLPWTRWQTLLQQWPEPDQIKTAMQWDFPEWNAHWTTRIILKKWRQSSRLQAEYHPIGKEAPADVTPEAVRILRQEMHTIPIFQVQPVANAAPHQSVWDHWAETADSHHQLNRLRRHLSAALWPKDQKEVLPVRIRFNAQYWQLLRLESFHGTWVLKHRAYDLRVLINWPQHSHPGALAVQWKNARIGLHQIDPHCRIDRYCHHWRYWADVVACHLLPDIEQFLQNNAKISAPHAAPDR